MDYTNRKHHTPGGESTERFAWTKVLEITGICALVVIFLINSVTLEIDGNLTGVIVGAIVYVATKTYYKEKLKLLG